MFPNHIGLNLNQVQVALAKSKENGLDVALKSLCESRLKNMCDLSSEDKQYERYKFLVKELAKVYSDN